MEVQSRTLKNNKGVVITGKYSGDHPYTVKYKTSKGETKTLTFECGNPLAFEKNFYGHVDDEHNELLVLSSRPFPY